MQVRFDRGLSYVFLCVSPLLMVAVWSTRLLASPTVKYGTAIVMIGAILIAAWTLGARVTVSGEEERRRFALAGGLIVAVWASLTLIGVLGRPDQATVSENKLRYVVLLADAILMAGGLMVLRDALGAAGERFYSGIGFAAIVLAGPLYVIFTIIQQLAYRAAERVGSGQRPAGSELLDTLSVGLLFPGAVLTYLASAAFAASLGRSGWLGRRASRVYVGTSLIAALCVGIRVAEALLSSDGPMWGFKHWYSIPGFVLLIPAVPWVMPCLFSIALLRRVGDEQSG